MFYYSNLKQQNLYVLVVCLLYPVVLHCICIRDIWFSLLCDN